MKPTEVLEHLIKTAAQNMLPVDGTSAAGKTIPYQGPSDATRAAQKAFKPTTGPQPATPAVNPFTWTGK